MRGREGEGETLNLEFLQNLITINIINCHVGYEFPNKIELE